MRVVNMEEYVDIANKLHSEMNFTLLREIKH